MLFYCCNKLDYDKEKHMQDDQAKLERIKGELAQANAVLIGAGAGLSAAAGFTYAGARFETYFHDDAASR